MANEKSFKSCIRDLEPGQELELAPGQKEATARSYCSALAFLRLRRYTVSRDRNTRTVPVKRLQ